MILKESLQPFKRKKIREAFGSTTRISTDDIIDKKIIDFKSWGKHLIIEFENFSLRIHFLMFGSYRINERKAAKPRLHLGFAKGELNFYTCSIIKIEDSLDTVYDWTVDVMSDQWSAAKARRTVKKNPNTTAGDILLNQNIFAGVGNIIKNEVLFRIRVHPETLVKNLPPRKLTALVAEARKYSFDFYEWKKIFQLKKHWLIYTKRKCPVCKGPVTKKPTGLTKRRSFFCQHCQPYTVTDRLILIRHTQHQFF